MASLKGLAKDTAIYGLSSIVGRFLNYLLTPLYTYKISAASGGYGVITNLYAYTALLLVILTYGMETTFFYYANNPSKDPKKVFSTILRMVGTTSVLFVAMVLAFIGPVSSALGYADHPSWVWTMALIVAIDAFQCILFAYLRYQKKAVKFASLKLLNIGMNILLNLAFFLFLPRLYELSPSSVSWIYSPEVGVGYVFYINLFCSAFLGLFLLKELKGISYGFDKGLMKEMLSYAWPILILGIAGVLNQTADKMLFPKLCKASDASSQLGIYGAATKIAMIMGMITQAFRYAYEPFVFGSAKEKDSKVTYSKGMKYFIIFTLLAFLGVMSYMGLLKYIISPDYWPGLKVVPIVMAAEIMMGIYFNISFWYKLKGETYWGAVFSGIGCAALILVNVLFVPKYGFMACAWGGFAGYGLAMVTSYLVGQKREPIEYPVKDIAVYFLLAAVLYIGITFFNSHLGTWTSMLCNTVLLLIFLYWIIRNDLPLSGLPVIGKYFKK